MERITSPEAADRLAHSVAADFVLDHGKVMHAGPARDELVVEGRGVYRAQVSEAYYPLYEMAVVETLHPGERFDPPGRKGYYIILGLSAATLAIVTAFALLF